jgi:hypothetical protein
VIVPFGNILSKSASIGGRGSATGPEKPSITAPFSSARIPSPEYILSMPLRLIFSPEGKVVVGLKEHMPP